MLGNLLENIDTVLSSSSEAREPIKNEQATQENDVYESDFDFNISVINGKPTELSSETAVPTTTAELSSFMSPETEKRKGTVPCQPIDQK